MSSQMIMSLVLILAGLGCAFWAAEKGPNHWFGIRFSFILQDAGVWRKTNRFGGLLFLAFGVLFFFLACILPAKLEAAFVLAAVSCILLIVLFTYFYARNLASGKLKADIPPYLKEWKKIYVLLISLLSLALLALGLFLYRYLPGEMAVHFRLDGQPDGFMLKPAAVFLPVFLQLMLLGFFSFVYQDTMLISARNAALTLGCFFSCHLAVALVNMDIWLYNWQSRHILNMEWVAFLLPVFILFPPLFFWWLVRRKEKGLKDRINK